MSGGKLASSAELARAARFDAQPWAPTIFTKPLSKDMVTDGDRLIWLVERFYRTPDGALIRLDWWQRALIRHVLERYPLDWPVVALRGRLRYRQVVISMGRQNGKSILGAIFALYGLLQHCAAPSVVGIATSVEQAGVVYDRVHYAVKAEPELSRRLKASGTRGIRHRSGRGGYFVKPALEEGLQSVPITLAIADELHLSRESMWDSVVNGQRAQLDALIVGITTAGDDDSDLLKRLYERGEAAVLASEPGRFGFFLWTAPAGSTIWTPGALEAANPAIACGRIDRDTVLSDIATNPEPDQQRYALNQMIAKLSTWLPLVRWHDCATADPPAIPASDVVFAVARTDRWQHATITASWRTDAGVHVEPVASLARPDRDRIIAVLEVLLRRIPRSAVALEGTVLGNVGRALKDRGHEVHALSGADMCQASAGAYAAITGGTLTHPGDKLTTSQMPHVQRINVGEAWRITARGRHDVDAVLAAVVAHHVAQLREPAALQLF